MRANRFFQAPTATAGAVEATQGFDTIDLGAVELAAANVREIDYEIQQLESLNDGIDNLYSVAEQSLDDGGLTAQAYAVVQSAAAQIMSIANYNPLTVNQQSFEGGASDRATATNVTMLALKDTIKNIWDSIIKAIKEAMEKVQVWFKKMTNAVPALIKKLEKVKEEAGKKTSGLKDDADIKLSASSVAALGKGKTPTISRDAIKGVAKELKGKSSNIRTLSSAIEKANKEAGDALNAIKADTPKDIVDSVNSVITFFNAYFSAASDVGSKASAAQITDLGLGDESKVLDLDVGNQGVVFNTKVETVSIISGVSGNELSATQKETLVAAVKNLLTASQSQLSIRNVMADVEDASEMEFKAFTSTDITDICDDAIELLTEFKKYNEDQVKIDKQRKDAISKAEKFAAKADDIKGPEKDPSLARQATDAAKAAANIVKNTGSLVPGFAGLCIKTSNVLLGVAGDSLKAHK